VYYLVIKFVASTTQFPEPWSKRT